MFVIVTSEYSIEAYGLLTCFNLLALFSFCKCSFLVLHEQKNSFTYLMIILIIMIVILKATFNRKPLILSADITVPAMPHRPF